MTKTWLGEHDLSAYALVADRITLFYQRYPAGRLVTELVSRTGREITFRAQVFRGPADVEPAATGWASEREGDGEINQVACLENTETSADHREDAPPPSVLSESLDGDLLVRTELVSGRVRGVVGLRVVVRLPGVRGGA